MGAADAITIATYSFVSSSVAYRHLESSGMPLHVAVLVDVDVVDVVDVEVVVDVVQESHATWHAANRSKS